MRLLAIALSVLVTLPALARTSTDLAVGWISRHPELEYVVNSANPRVEGWPAVGEVVTWRAHVRNWSSSPRTARYEWRLDDRLLEFGTVSLPADRYETFDLRRPWSFERHELTFVIEAAGVLTEESEKNNLLTIFTDALAVGFWVEESFYQQMRENQHHISGAGSASFEDWAQRHIAEFNRMAPLAIYPESPRGVLDRWRIQKIVIVPDGSLPLVPVDPKDGNGATHPDSSDRTVDMSWGFRAADRFNNPEFTPVLNNPFFLNGSLIHELGHARYLIDVYAFRVQHVPPRYRVEITENGALAIGRAMPAETLISNGTSGFLAHSTRDTGLMSFDYSWIDRHSAAAMNLIAGARAVNGTSNVPANYAAYINDLPAQNRVTLVDPNGVQIAGAEVDLFQAVRADDDLTKLDSYLSALYDDVPDLHFTTDAFGQILVGRNPFTPRGSLDGFRLAELTAILRVRKDGVTRFGFLESRLFNLAYWRGEREIADHTVTVGMPTCGGLRAQASSPTYGATLNSNTIRLRWSSAERARAYTLWASEDGRPPIALVEQTTQTQADVTLGGNVSWWVETHYAAPCPSRRSPVFVFSAPSRPAPGERRRVSKP